MRLKDYTYLLRCVGLLLVCTLLHSCMEDVSGDCPASLSSDNAYVGLRFGTRSALPSLSESVENGVNTLRVIVVDKDGKVEFNDRFTATNLDRVDNPVFKVSKGKDKKIYVIANEDGKQAKGSKTLSQELEATDLTEEKLQKIIFMSKFYTQTTAGTDGLLMIGSASIEEVKGGTSLLSPQFVSVEIAHVNSKLDINARKIWNPLGADKNVVINSIDITNIMRQEYLYIDEDGVNPEPGLILTTPEIVKSAIVTAEQTSADDASHYQSLVTCFSGTNIVTELEAESMKLTINYSVDGHQQAEVTIPVTRSPDFKVRRNTHYTVNLTIYANRLDVTMDIKDWNVETVDGDIDDEGSEIITNNSLVEMDWWDLGKRFDTELLVSAGSKKTVVFDGYYISEVDVNTEGYGKKTKISKDELGTKIPWLTISNAPTEGDAIALNSTMTINMKYTPKPGKLSPPSGISTQTRPLYDDLYLRFRSGNIVKDIKVKYQNGYISDEMLRNANHPWSADTRPLKKGSLTEHSGIHLMSQTGGGTVFWNTHNKWYIGPKPVIPVGLFHGDGIKNNLIWSNYDAMFDESNRPMNVIKNEITKFPKWGNPESWFVPSRDELQTVMSSMYMYLGPNYSLASWCAYDLNFTVHKDQVYVDMVYRGTGQLSQLSGGFGFFPICYADI